MQRRKPLPADDERGGPGADAPPAPTGLPAGTPAFGEESLRNQTLSRCALLRDQFGRKSGGSDILSFLEILSEDRDAVIRQPPAAAIEAMRLAQDPAMDVPQVVRLFERDPKLAQALLQMANSAFFRRGAAVSVSLLDAVNRVGMGGVYNVILMSVLHGSLMRPGAPHDVTAGKVWSHMTRTGYLGRWISPAFGVPPDLAFSLALLHDVGKLVVFDRLSELRRRMSRDPRLPESFVLGSLVFLHEPLGGLAVLRWKLGEAAARSVATHHRRPVPEEIDHGSELLYVAERVDLASVRRQEIDWDQLWADGQLSASREEAMNLVEVAVTLQRTENE